MEKICICSGAKISDGNIREDMENSELETGDVVISSQRYCVRSSKKNSFSYVSQQCKNSRRKFSMSMSLKRSN